MSGITARKPAAQGIQGCADSGFLREKSQVPSLKVITELLFQGECGSGWLGWNPQVLTTWGTSPRVFEMPKSSAVTDGAFNSCTAHNDQAQCKDRSGMQVCAGCKLNPRQGYDLLLK